MMGRASWASAPRGHPAATRAGTAARWRRSTSIRPSRAAATGRPWCRRRWTGWRPSGSRRCWSGRWRRTPGRTASTSRWGRAGWTRGCSVSRTRSTPRWGSAGLTRSLGADRPVLHHLEVASGDGPEGPGLRVGEAGVGCPGEPEARAAAIVGDEHPVLLERPEDDLHPPAEAGDVDVALQPDAQPHRGAIRAHRARSGGMGRGPDEPLLAVAHHEPEGVGDVPRVDLVPADQAREDGEAGGVGGGPAEGPGVVGPEVPLRAVGSVPGAIGVP